MGRKNDGVVAAAAALRGLEGEREMNWRLSAAAAILLCGSAGAAQTPQSPAARAFERLSALAGTWSGSWANGRAHSVTYRLSAGGTALVETWALGPGRESITIYHLDGDRLLATHYCPQGTQPRLALAPAREADRLDFALVDGANLNAPGRSHQHNMTIWLRGADRFERSEHYVENGAPAAAGAAEADEVVAYRRVLSQ